jgi:integrase
MASIRKRESADGKVSWHVQVRLLGFDPQTKTFDRKSDAEAWGQETERLMKTGRFNTADQAQRRTVTELFEVFQRDYMRETRRKDYTQILNWWAVRIGRLHLANLKAATIQKVIDEFQREPLGNAAADTAVSTDAVLPIEMGTRRKPEAATKVRAAGTVIRYLAVLSRALNVAVENLEWLDRSPMAGVKRPHEQVTKIVRTLTRPEEKALLEAATRSDNKFLTTIILVALRTGMRYSELMNLRWEDIEFRSTFALITLRKTKNKRQRIVPLVRDALAAVKALQDSVPAASGPDLLFPSAEDKSKPVEIRRAWETSLKRARITGFRYHDLRHSAASRWASLGYSLAEIAEILGHSDHRSTQIYTHFEKSHAVKMAQHAADAAIINPDGASDVETASGTRE